MGSQVNFWVFNSFFGSSPDFLGHEKFFLGFQNDFWLGKAWLLGPQVTFWAFNSLIWSSKEILGHEKLSLRPLEKFQVVKSFL